VEVLASIALALQRLVLDVRNRSYNNYDLVATLQSYKVVPSSLGTFYLSGYRFCTITCHISYRGALGMQSLDSQTVQYHPYTVSVAVESHSLAVQCSNLYISFYISSYLVAYTQVVY